MKTIDRILYGICATATALTALILIAFIWGDFDEVLASKIALSGGIIIGASGIMLGINLQILKAKAEIEAKRKGKPEPGS
jgi:hypothetical protein